MDNKAEEFYYDITEKDYLWKSEEMNRVVGFIRGTTRDGRGKVLEVGCGIAGIVPHLPEGVEYIGTDVSEYGIKRAREVNHRPNVKFEVMSADVLSFGANFFNSVIAFNVIEHCRRPKPALDEMVRVLRPGGVLVITGPNLDFPLSISNGIRHRGKLYKNFMRSLRIFDYLLRIFGYLRFRTIRENFTEATGRYEKPDDDLRYFCSAYEVIEYVKRKGLKIKWVNPFPKSGGWKGLIKKVITYLPGMKYYGRALFVIMES